MSADAAPVLLMVAALLCLFARSKAGMEVSGFIGFWLCLIAAVATIPTSLS